jgi:hypothetical protein
MFKLAPGDWPDVDRLKTILCFADGQEHILNFCVAGDLLVAVERFGSPTERGNFFTTAVYKIPNGEKIWDRFYKTPIRPKRFWEK